MAAGRDTTMAAQPSESSSLLDFLRESSVVVADTSDLDAIRYSTNYAVHISSLTREE